MKITTVGLDLAKSVFHVVCFDTTHHQFNEFNGVGVIDSRILHKKCTTEVGAARKGHPSFITSPNARTNAVTITPPAGTVFSTDYAP
jgi:hypothetical protein